jgi:glyoxylase-like metal-dependent hydrolase (beta-lactamase superfamily II)
MTLDGTNSWVLRAPGAVGCVIVDPGPDDPDHLRALADHAPVEAIMITHGHPDHTAGVDPLVAMLGADVPVLAASDRWARGPGRLADGARQEMAGLSITAWATAGHTADSFCFLVSDPATVTGAVSPVQAVLTGDTILGRGTTVVAWPDGDLGDYLASLAKLSALSEVPLLPGHGPVRADCGAIAAEYRAHREDRLVQVRAARAGGAHTPSDVVAAVYPDLDPALVPAAEWTVRAALAYLDSA